jgi:uncharacterized delta-60 repeat protein
MSAGSLDPQFGSGGTAVLTNSLTFVPYDVAVDSMNRIVVAGLPNGYAVGPCIVTRYTSNGTLDNSFGNHGVVTIAPDSPFGFSALRGSVAIDSHDRIIIAGTSYFSSLVNDDGDNVIGGGQFSVVRLNAADGSLDSTFNGSGIKTFHVGSTDDFLGKVAVDLCPLLNVCHFSLGNG